MVTSDIGRFGNNEKRVFVAQLARKMLHKATSTYFLIKKTISKDNIHVLYSYINCQELIKQSLKKIEQIDNCNIVEQYVQPFYSTKKFTY